MKNTIAIGIFSLLYILLAWLHITCFSSYLALPLIFAELNTREHHYLCCCLSHRDLYFVYRTDRSCRRTNFWNVKCVNWEYVGCWNVEDLWNENSLSLKMLGFLSNALGPLSATTSTLMHKFLFKNQGKDTKTLNFNDEWVFWDFFFK